MDHCRRNGWTPCFYEAAEENLPADRTLGLGSLKIAEEAVIDLASFSLAGGKRAALRALVHKVTRAGLAVHRYERNGAADPGHDEQLEAISEEWLAEKRLGEMGFTLGRFSLDALRGVRVFLCASAHRVEAFCSWLEYRGGRAVVLDLMRKRGDAVSGNMDLLLAESLLALKAEGLEEASLATAPLANVGEPHGPSTAGWPSSSRTSTPSTGTRTCSSSRRSSVRAGRAVPGLPARVGLPASRWRDPRPQPGRPDATPAEALGPIH